MERTKPNIIYLQEIFRLLYRNWKIILIAFLSVFLSVSLLTFFSDKIYEATATLSIRQEGDYQRQLFDIPSVYYQKYLIKNQVAVLESRSLATDVIQRLQNSIYRDSLSILGNHSPVKPGIRNKLISIIKKNDLKKTQPSMREMIKSCRSSIKVNYGADSDIIEIKGKSNHPYEAALIVNILIESYQDYIRTGTLGEVSQTKQFLEEKLEEIEQKLAVSEDRLARFKKRENVVSLTSETEQLITQVAGFESLYNETKTELESVDKQLTYLKKQLNESKRNMVDDMVKLSSPVLQELQKTMSEIVANKAAYEAQLIGAGYSPSGDPKLVQMENRLNGVKEKIVEESKKMINRDIMTLNPLNYSEKLITQILELETTQQSLYAKTRALQNILMEYSNQLEELPDKSLELVRLERDVQVNNKLYIMLREKTEETRIQEAGQSGVVRIIDFAVPPHIPVFPKTKLNLFMGFFFGLLLGAALAYSREYLLDTIKDETDVESLGIRVIGRIPDLKKDFSKRYQKDLKEWNVLRAKEIFPFLISHNKADSMIKEAYKSLRTSIFFIDHKKKIRTLLFTSAGPAEGKSTSAANLAISMAQNGMKTLLIDSDLRRPVLDVLFIGSHRKVGLSNILRRKIDWKDTVRETSVSNLSMISAGSEVENASELLCSQSMIRMLNYLKTEYDIVILDSPPLLPVTDASVLAALCDGVVLVAKVGKTSQETIRKSLEQLKSVDARILGSVITAYQTMRHYSYQEYYQTQKEKSQHGKTWG